MNRLVLRWSSRLCNKSLTLESYKRFASTVARGNFKVVDDADLAHFKSITNGVITDQDLVNSYNSDWIKLYKGRSKVVLQPKSTHEVSKILEYCNTNKIAVVPQSGNTGLVGGSVPVYDEVILSLTKLNSIRSFDEVSGILVSDAGLVLQEADSFVGKHGYTFPLDLGAKGSCCIGGNVATNAGGLRLLRYGNLHGSVVGLEVVLASGEIVDVLSTMRKDNTGYDIKQLFIGSEGTLGVITGVSILCPPRSKSKNVALLTAPSFDAVQKAFVNAKSQLGEILSAFEMMDSTAVGSVKEFTDVKNPLGEDVESPFYILVETAGSNAEHDSEKLQDYLADMMEKNIVRDGTISSNETQFRAIWRMRESVTETVNAYGSVYKYDLSIPLAKLYDIVGDLKAKLADEGLYGAETSPVVAIAAYGHIGDGNLHLNVMVREKSPRIENALEPWLFEWTGRVRGSISAEHGVGRSKPPYLHYCKSLSALRMMATLKATYDPNGILNPYKVVEQI